MDELQPVVVEAGNAGRVIAGGEVRMLGWLALIDTACPDRSCVRGIDSLITPADDAEVRHVSPHARYWSAKADVPPTPHTKTAWHVDVLSILATVYVVASLVLGVVSYQAAQNNARKIEQQPTVRGESFLRTRTRR